MEGKNETMRANLERFKNEAAAEVGVTLKQGYNGDLTSREAGSVGGQMVKKMCPIRIASYDRNSRVAPGHTQAVRYIVSLNV